MNETILIGDPAGGDTFEDCLNKVICKSAFVRHKSGRTADVLSATSVSELMWWDGTPLEPAGGPPLAPVPQRTNSAGVPPGAAPALLTGADAWEWPGGCAPFYKVPALKARFAKRFTEPESPGRIYRSTYDALERALRLPAGGHADRGLAAADGAHHALLPAFFHTLHALHAAGRDFAVVVRTFGTDGPEVAKALSAWAAGAHAQVGGAHLPNMEQVTPS